MKPILSPILIAAGAALLLAACEQSPPQVEPPVSETTAGEDGAPAPDGATPDAAPSDGLSVYTALDLADCEITARYEEGAGTDWRCEGRNGVPLLVRESDGRFDIDAGVTGSAPGIGPFNNPGPRVEWRGPAASPYAIIYRLVSATPEAEGQTWLVVETIGTVSAPGCPVAVIEGGVPSANVRAREEADTRARTFRCDVDEPTRVGA